ncbi:MAG: DMT family transporter [Gammaproteobacteria bacterium]|nr:DMT family transporter [Gammaproteobacteria bacterium]
MSNSRIWPYMLVLFAGFVWGITFSLARIATAAGAHPLGLTFWQGAGGAFVLLIICAIRGRWPIVSTQYFKFYVLLGLIGTAIPGVLFFYAAPHVPAGVLAITVATVPFITYAGSMLMGIDSYSAKRTLGIAAGMLAIIVLVTPETSLPERSMVVWVLLVLISSLFYSAESIYVDMHVPKDADAIALLAGMLLVAAVLILPVVVASDSFVPLSWPWGDVEWSVAAMAVVSSLAYATFLYVIQIAGSVFATQTGYVVTISGVFWGIMMFNEQHSVWVWLALALILFGLALVTPLEREPVLVESLD